MSSTQNEVSLLLDAGHSVNEIALRLRLSPNTVRYHAGRIATPTTRRAPAPPPDEAIATVRTRAAVEDLLSAGASRAEIARRLGISKSTVSYHARRLGAEIDERCARRYDWALVQQYYDAGHTLEECVAAFGFSRCSWHDAVKRGDLVPRSPSQSLEKMFARGTNRNNVHLKRRLLAEGIKQARCEECGVDRWLGRTLVLALHHINGDRHDNRIENLQLLCPNCHSQTDNFAGRNRTSRLVPGAEDERGRPPSA